MWRTMAESRRTFFFEDDMSNNREGSALLVEELSIV